MKQKETYIWLVCWLTFVVAQLAFRGALLYYFIVHHQVDVGTQLWKALLIGIRFDLRLAVLLALPLLLLIMLRNIFVKLKKEAFFKRVLASYFFLAFIALIAVYVVDFYHYEYLQERLNASVLRFYSNLDVTWQMLWQSYPVLKLLLVAILMAGLITWGLLLFYKKIYDVKKIHDTQEKPVRTSGSSKLSLFARACGVIFVIYFSLMGKVTSIVPIRWSEAFFSRDPAVVAMALNPVLFLYDSSKYTQETFDSEQTQKYLPIIKKSIVQNNVNQFDTPGLSRKFFAQNQPKPIPNIIFIHLESLGANRMRFFGNPLSATPFLDELAKQSVMFEKFYVPSVGTAKSIFSLLTSIPDVSLVKTATRNPFAVDQFMPINAAHDYEKYYFIGGSANWAQVRGLLVHNIHGLALYEEGDWQSPVVDVWGISDYSLFKESSQVLSKSKKPFLAFIQTAGNHGPYTIPDEDNGFEKDTTEHEFENTGFLDLDQYNATRLLDHNVKQFFSMAKPYGFYENTLFVLYGDHNGPTKPSSILLEDEKAHVVSHHVPLMMLYAGPEKILQQPSIVKTPASLIDVIPTALSLAGIPHELRTLGQNIFDKNPLAAKSFLFSSVDRVHPQYAVVGNDGIYVFNELDKKLDRFWFAEEKYHQPSLNTNDSGDQVEIDWARGMYEVSRFLILNNDQEKHLASY